MLFIKIQRKNFRIKVQYGRYFIIFNAGSLLHVFNNIFFSMTHKNVQVGSGFGRIRNKLASWIRIRNLGLRIRGFGFLRNIYGSSTLRERQIIGDPCPEHWEWLGLIWIFYTNKILRYFPKQLEKLLRYLQVVEDGYEFFAKRQLVTLFSAPNYCGEFDNAGQFLREDCGSAAWWIKVYVDRERFISVRDPDLDSSL